MDHSIFGLADTWFKLNDGQYDPSMPISFQIDDVSRRIHTVAEGEITYADLQAHMNADVPPEVVGYSEIFDCTGATTDMTADDVRRLATERERIAGSREVAGPVAVIATNDLFFGMFRMFDVLTSRVRPLRVFRTIIAAERWLELIELGVDPFEV